MSYLALRPELIKIIKSTHFWRMVVLFHWKLRALIKKSRSRSRKMSTVVFDGYNTKQEQIATLG